jgi:uncharacterized FlaG/YvyC family protein
MNISSSIPVAASDLRSGLSPADVADRQRIARAIHALNQMNVFGANRELTFALDRGTHRMVIHVIDRDTHETIMQLPAENILRMLENLK